MRAFVLALCVLVSLAAFGQIGFQQRSYPAGAMLNTSVALAPGKYNLSIVAYEGNGAALKASESITVQ